MIWTTVPTAAGDLRAIIHVPPDDPDRPGPLPGLVLVDGSGDGACDDWGQWPDRLCSLGAVVLTHDKPGCGGSPGHWTEQSLHDRARETLAAVEVLRAHPSVSGGPVGLLGASQGGWVATLAANLSASTVDFVVSISGPGVSPAVQERARIEADLRAEDTPPEALAEAMAWYDERTARLIGGEPVETVLADQERYADRGWYSTTTRFFDNPVMLRFLARLLPFEPADVLSGVECPVLALFGGADTVVPVPESVVAYASHLRGAGHGIAVFPGADHGLYTGEQPAAGFLPMVSDFLAGAAAVAAVRGNRPDSAGAAPPVAERVA